MEACGQKRDRTRVLTGTVWSLLSVRNIVGGQGGT